MSKRKTREQKIKAELRFLKSQIQGENSPLIKIDLPKIAQTINPTIKTSVNYDYVFADIRKIFWLSLTIISLEIGLSLTTRIESAKLILSSIGFKF